jgi:hypothetical protein
MRRAVAAPSRGASSNRVTRPPVARATPAEGAAPSTSSARSPSGSDRGPARTVCGPSYRSLTGPLRRWDGPPCRLRSGVHFCLDAALARMEARTVFSTVLHRIPGWNTERRGHRGAQDHSVATPPSPRCEPRQRRRGMSTDLLQGTGLRWMPKTSALGRARSSRKSDPKSQTFSSTGYASADQRKHPFVSRYGRGSGDCGVGLQKRPVSGRVWAVRAHRSPLTGRFLRV